MNSGDAFSASQPLELFAPNNGVANFNFNFNGNAFDVSRGQFLLPLFAEQGASATPVTVVLDWQARLKN